MRYDWIAAFRGITRNPGFAALVVLTFALGIGSNSAIFSVAYGVLLRPLTFPDQDRLVRFTEMVRKNVEFNVSYPNFLSWRERSRSFEQLAIYNPVHEYLFRGPHGVEAIPVATAEGHLFAMLGHPPALGRSFTEEEQASPSPTVTVLTHAFWEKRLGRDPNVLGRALPLGDSLFTVIGVLPPGFVLGNSELYVPIRPTLTPVSLDRGNHPGFAAIGRLKPGVTVAQARTEMEAISEELERQYPATNRDTRVKVTPLLESIVGSVQTPLLLLLGAVGFVLLIACANIANLLLAKAASRTREVAIRMALGAGRAGVLRFFLAESLILAGLGGAAGALLAAWLVDLIRVLQPGLLPRASAVRVDGTTFAYLLLVTVVAGLAAGLLPAWHASRANVHEALKKDGRGLAGSPGRQRLRWALVAIQVALSVVLLAGAGLMVRTLLHLDGIALGFRSEGVFSVELKYDGPSAGLQNRYRHVLESLRSRSADDMAAAVWPPLFGRFGWVPPVDFAEKPAEPGKEPLVHASAVSPQYFEVMDIPLRRGRLFNGSDRDGSPSVVLVNETLVRRFWPGGDAIGKRLRIAGAGSPAEWSEIVGVVGDTRRNGPAFGPPPEVYWPVYQFSMPPSLVVRSGAGDGFARMLREELVKLDPALVVHRITPVPQLVADASAQRRFLRLLLGVLAGLAALLAAVGLYGVVSYTMAQRRREIGVRMALGAVRADILRLAARHGLGAVAGGIAAGLAGCQLLTGFLATQVHGVTPYDPAALGGAAALMLLLAAGASTVPALRASSQDPLEALRQD